MELVLDIPSLYEMYYVYAANADSLPYVKAEKSKSFDIGIEKTYNKLNYDLTYFNTSYSNVLEGWKTEIVQEQITLLKICLAL